MGIQKSQTENVSDLTSNEQHIAAKNLCQAAKETSSDFEEEALRKAAEAISPH